MSSKPDRPLPLSTEHAQNGLFSDLPLPVPPTADRIGQPPEGPGTHSPGRLRRWAPSEWVSAPGWRPTLDAFWRSPEGQQLGHHVQQRLDAGARVYPAEPLRALALTALPEVKVVVLGQDPYHGPGQAEGLAFSVPSGQRIPPSLRNIFQELARDLAVPAPRDGSLVRWAEQGVLLLNTSLTVEDGLPGSHAKRGWEALTDQLIRQVALVAPHCAFLLWGAHAQARAGVVAAVAGASERHAVLLANHPSPLSARRPPVPFIGCGHFGQANRFLENRGLPPIQW